MCLQRTAFNLLCFCCRALSCAAATSHDTLRAHAEEPQEDGGSPGLPPVYPVNDQAVVRLPLVYLEVHVEPQSMAEGGSNESSLQHVVALQVWASFYLNRLMVLCKFREIQSAG